MNKIHNLFTTLLLAVTALALGSCTDEYEYTAATVEGQQVYFSNTLASTQNLSDTESSFNISLNRIMTDGELTVNLTIDDASGIYSMPSSVSFADGEDEVSIPVSYDPTKLEYDVFNDVTIAIADVDYTTPYGNSSYSFSAGMPSPYVSIGTGKFADTYLIEEGYAEVEIMQNQNNPNQFRVMHPYDEFAEAFAEAGYNLSGEPAEYLEFEVLQPGETLNGVTVTKQDLVYFSPTATSIILNDSYGVPVTIMHPCHFTDYASEDAWTHNCVTAWQEDGTPGTVQLAPMYYMDGVGGWDNTQADGMITITFPGYNPKDYSMNVSYLGAFSSADGESFAMGNVTLGADIEEAKVAVVEGNDVNAALSQIMSGAVETTTVTESGEVRIPCKYSGTCTMVAIGYAEGEMQAYNAATFEFTLGPSEWTSIGTGLYTDYILCTFLYDSETGAPAPAINYPVTVQESTTTPGVYRLLSPYDPEVNPYGSYFSYDASSSYNIIINASDPDAVYMQMQPTGVTAGQDGDIYIMSYGGYGIDQGNSFADLKAAGMIKGYLKDGVITFDAQELCYALTGTGYMYYASEEETPLLTLPSAASAQAKAKAAKAAKAYGNRMTVKANPKLLASSSLKAKKMEMSRKNAKAFQLNKNVKLNRK